VEWQRCPIFVSSTFDDFQAERVLSTNMPEVPIALAGEGGSVRRNDSR